MDPASRPPIRKFHIIHPVDVYQKNLSSSPTFTWSAISFRCSIMIPPWPWTMALGSPVVPEE